MIRIRNMALWILVIYLLCNLLHPTRCSERTEIDLMYETDGFTEVMELTERDSATEDDYITTYRMPPAGPITGKVLHLSQQKKVIAYLGVPYAEPPTGKLRFKRPVKLTPWEEVFNATEFGPLCVQSKLRHHWDIAERKDGKRVLHRIGLWDYPQGEDCLNLNIYVPFEDQRTEGASVMVYIHGGSYKSNGGRFYPGEWLASKGGLVVVTLNYRLGVLGFLSTNDVASKGNYGLHDQRMALEWIKENIASFGGNPNDVTIFGNSAGGACVGLHLLSPLSCGLFHKAIIQSGSPTGEWAIQKRPRLYTEQLASKLKCPDVKDGQRIVECLRNTSVDKIIEKTEDAKTLGDTLMLQFAPVVDGEFLKLSSLSALLKTSLVSVPVIIGITKDELEVWMIRTYQDKDPSKVPFTKSLLRKYLLHMIRKDSISSVAVDVLLHIVYAEYTRNRRETSPVEINKTTRPDIRTLGKIISDIDLKAPSVKFIELLSRYSYAPVFMYEFDYASSDDVFVTNAWAGSYHESELYYIFGLPHLALDNAFRPPEDKQMSDTMIKLWSDFAKHGNPTPDDITSILQNFTWPEYTVNDKSYAVLSLQPHIYESYEPQRMIFWNHFVPMITEYSVRPSVNHECGMDFVVAMYIVGWLSFPLCLQLLAYIFCKRFKRIRMRSLPIPV